MSLMGSLYVGASGLQTGQNALNTTAHNLSNVDTKGYSRQQVLLGDRVYSKLGDAAISPQQIGLGVNYAKVRQVRDMFMDQAYRRETGRGAFYETYYNSVSELESFFGEMYGTTFGDSLGSLKKAIDELAKAPGSAVNQELLVNSANAFLERADSVYSGLISYQNNMNLQVKGLIDKINRYGNQIYELNDAIRKAEAGGIESANDLRDTRNLLLDQLSAMADITYKEDEMGGVTVSLEGVQFVLADKVFEMGYTEDALSGFYTPVWPQNENASVFNPAQVISKDLNTDIGELKAMVIARGDHVADFRDLDDTINGNGYYSNVISKSVMMNTQAEFDRLIHGVVTAINGVLNPVDASGNSTSYDLFVRKTEDRDHNLVPEDTDDSTTLFRSGNLKINPELLKQPTLLEFRTADGSEDFTKAYALQAAFTDKFDTLNPDETKKCNFEEFYSELVDQIASIGKAFGDMASNQAATAQALDNKRQQVSGVSSEEELTNMIKFQNAYNASSRFINVVNEMLEHILERLG